MFFGSTIQAVLRLARVALATILLVGVPLAEAATCGAEVSPVGVELTASAEADHAAAIQDDANGAEHGKQSGEAQHCIHGHCHHATPFKNVDVGAAVEPVADTRTVVHEPGFVLARVVIGLERPPKI